MSLQSYYNSMAKSNVPYIVRSIPRTNRNRPCTVYNKNRLVIHSTANPRSTAQNERDWLVNPSNNRTASWNIAVDDKQVVEAIPVNEESYHAGKRSGNRYGIGLEICESGNRAKTIANAVETSARILHHFGWSVGHMERHFDYTGKNCPRIFSANNWREWNKFKERVNIRLLELKVGGKPKEVKPVLNERENKAYWYLDARGLMSRANPNDPLLRRHFATVLYDLLEGNGVVDDWAKADWEQGKELGLITDSSNPTQQMTMQQMVAVMMRFKRAMEE